ncbi:MAG: carbon-nitrogen hydrolase family protein [Planctomycetota bacterium]|jgi:predicted amidohydrolase
MAGKLKIATCQFATGESIKRNAALIMRFMRKAKQVRADIAHFHECALSGYVGTDFKTFENYNWDLLSQETEKITALANQLKLWVVLGSVHKRAKANKPYNSLYLIGPDGKVAGRYDKRFCIQFELHHHTPGDKFVNFQINGVKCSLLICFDVRFPEIYRKLYKQGVKCIFQSFYNARQKGPSVHKHIMRQSMQCRAATNHFWVSMANSSGYYSPYPSCFIEPDGKIIGQLKLNRAGMMVNTVDLKKKFYDPSRAFRDMAIDGKLSNK